jgi:hypothetical protein
LRPLHVVDFSIIGEKDRLMNFDILSQEIEQQPENPFVVSKEYWFW